MSTILATMVRHIDEGTIHQLLLKSEKDENSSRHERDHIEANPVYKTDGNEKVSTLTQQQLPSQDDQEISDTSPLQSIEDSIPSSSVQSSDLIVRP
ncbi:hypothetical protein EVAR_51420_1 [Eumeta japonica]|uniref:Uncharacterized protein n=1 Tax=Eumeta variegata TaxID=151549 RepID=A0A4C1XYE5_EUMVA|nr:hypothetical protein EVAR_51420_1 [Eumeta japonica]